MTPQLQQAIKLLQLSNVELAEYCESELEKNPLLERDDREAAPVTDAPDAASDTLPANVPTKRCPAKTSPRPPTWTRPRMTTCMTATFPPPRWRKARPAGSLTDWTTVKSGNSYEGEDGLESTVTAEASLKDHLENQLSIAALLPADRLILTGADRCGG